MDVMDTPGPTSELAADVEVLERVVREHRGRTEGRPALARVVARIADLEAQVRVVAQLAQGYEAAQRMEQERAERAEAQVAALTESRTRDTQLIDSLTQERDEIREARFWRKVRRGEPDECWTEEAAVRRVEGDDAPRATTEAEVRAAEASE